MKTFGLQTINQKEDSMPGCACGEKSNIYVFSCSGAADVGALSDQVARKMSKEGKGKMYCMAAVGANIPEKIAPLKSALGTVTIDGCSSLCAKKVLENTGFKPVSYNLEDFGFKKGKTEVTEEAIGGAISAMGL
jgi:uncharacterized metal-binding protein